MNAIQLSYSTPQCSPRRPSPHHKTTYAQRSFQPNHNVTVNFDGVPAPDDKLMDAVIADPHNEASRSCWVDLNFHVLDPTSPSNRIIVTSSGGQVDSQAQCSLQKTPLGVPTKQKQQLITAKPATTTLSLSPL